MYTYKEYEFIVGTFAASHYSSPFACELIIKCHLEYRMHFNTALTRKLEHLFIFVQQTIVVKYFFEKGVFIVK